MDNNHIYAFNNKQDSTCVIYLIESIVSCIKRILPDISMVILQNDNTELIQNVIVAFSIHTLVISTGTFVSNYTHTETGSGKGMIKGHFEITMKILRVYVDAVFDVCTLTQLV